MAIQSSFSLMTSHRTAGRYYKLLVWTAHPFHNSLCADWDFLIIHGVYPEGCKKQAEFAFPVWLSLDLCMVGDHPRWKETSWTGKQTCDEALLSLLCDTCMSVACLTQFVLDDSPSQPQPLWLWDVLVLLTSHLLVLLLYWSVRFWNSSASSPWCECQ